MELVRGIPITDYCDQSQLSIPERLELFVPVCQAVQHAHQKGIIHRDLKPSNVLVTLIDGVAVPKVIDFGVAKATGGQLTEKTLFTGFAPARRHAAVHEPRAGRAVGRRRRHAQRHLLAGRAAVRAADRHDAVRPRDVLHGGASTRSARIIREEEPPTPSTRLSTLGATLTTVSANRQADVAQAEPCRPRRARLDRDEGAGEGPPAAVRDGQRLRGRRDAAPDRPAGRGVPAVGVVSVPEVRPTQPGGSRRRRPWCPPPWSRASPSVPCRLSGR